MGKCFFKVYLPSLSSNRLRIPVTFMKHIEGETSGTFSFLGPSGKVWKVSLIETTDGFFFEEGWPVFVRDHSIVTGDFLVFEYNGNLHFTVLIYNPSECEKESAFYAICSQDTTCSTRDEGKKRGISREAVKVLNDSSYKSCEGLSKRKRGNVIVVSSHSAREFTSRKIKCEKNQFNQSNCFAVSKTANLEDYFHRNRRTLRRAPKIESEKPHLQTATKHLLNDVNQHGDTIIRRHRNCLSRERAREQVHTRTGALISQRRNVTEEEIDRAIKAAMAFESKNPYTLMVMRASHVYFGFFLGMPSSFRKSHLPKGNQDMILRDPNGRAWPVSYVGNNDRGAISAGWCALSHHNNIEADDVCIFELIKVNEIQLHIFRVVEEIRPLIRNSTRLKTQLGFGGKMDLKV